MRCFSLFDRGRARTLLTRGRTERTSAMLNLVRRRTRMPAPFQKPSRWSWATSTTSLASSPRWTRLRDSRVSSTSNPLTIPSRAEASTSTGMERELGRQGSSTTLSWSPSTRMTKGRLVSMFMASPDPRYAGRGLMP